MGYYSDAFGSYSFSRELTNEEWHDTVKHVWMNERDSWVLEQVATFNGTNVYIEVDGSKMYSFETEVKTMVQYLSTLGVRVNGDVTVYGEENGDIWRMNVVDSNAFRENAKLTWQDGTEVRTRF